MAMSRDRDDMHDEAPKALNPDTRTSAQGAAPPPDPASASLRNHWYGVLSLGSVFVMFMSVQRGSSHFDLCKMSIENDFA